MSTNVGGIPEVLPPDMVFLAPPTPEALIKRVEEAIKKYKKDCREDAE